MSQVGLEPDLCPGGPQTSVSLSSVASSPIFWVNRGRYSTYRQPKTYTQCCILQKNIKLLTSTFGLRPCRSLHPQTVVESHWCFWLWTTLPSAGETNETKQESTTTHTHRHTTANPASSATSCSTSVSDQTEKERKTVSMPDRGEDRSREVRPWCSCRLWDVTLTLTSVTTSSEASFTESSLTRHEEKCSLFNEFLSSKL